MVIETISVQNGEFWIPFSIYSCDVCGKELPENAPREEVNGKDYCGDCAFIRGLISEKELLDRHYYFIALPGLRAAIHNGEVQVTQGKFEWERSSRDRESKSYKEWRERVYERDNWTCQECGKYGGKLNAHHIKSYSKHPDLRLDVSNGITLCIECHRKKHKKRKGDCINE